MVRIIGLWMLLMILLVPSKIRACAPVFEEKTNVNLQSENPSKSLPFRESTQSNQNLKSDVLAKIEVMVREDEIKFMKTFNLGELSVLPYTPNSQPKSSARSQAYFTFQLPDVCGGVRVRTGLCYNLAETPKNGIGSQEQVLYLVSTKTLNSSKWKPFVSLSYMRSQLRGVPRDFHRGLEEMKNRSSVHYRGSQQRSQAAHYSNVEVLETCCGLQPHEKLSLVLSFNFLKPLDKKGSRLNKTHAKVFNEVKVCEQSQGLDLKLDYAFKKNMNILVKSECLLSNGSLKEKADRPVIIEGSLIVSF